MIFSSSPTTHIDAPNWNQHKLHHGQQLPSVSVDAHHQQHQLPLIAPQLCMAATAALGGGSSGAPGSSPARLGSMAERARMAMIPPPEPGRKCPRCDSTNTKFCYFNNYSLSQPRHFCKACRRYWTHGGALRSVPVGGRCRRNKRAKPSKKHSSSSSATASSSATSTSSSHIASVLAPPPPQSPLGLLHTLGPDRYSTMGVSRLGFAGLGSSPHQGVEYQDQLGGGDGPHRWRLPATQQPYPFLTRAEAVPLPPGLMASGSYPFDEAEAGIAEAASLAGQMLAGARYIRQMASVKMDDKPPSASPSSPREFIGLGENLPFWGGGDNGERGGGVVGGSASITAGGNNVDDLGAFNNSSSGYTPL